MEIINLLSNFPDKKNENEQKILTEDILSNKSFDEETIPDEDFIKANNKKRSKLNSCPNVEHKGPNINLKINYKDKICIIGNNGCGKSTLLKRIVENSSDNIKIGSNVKIGYIPQQINFNEEISILDYARKYYNGEESHLRSALCKFQFYGENVFKKVTKISGGEKVRLMLFTLIQDNCNFIILSNIANSHR